jgi:hypothetical protein
MHEAMVWLHCAGVIFAEISGSDFHDRRGVHPRLRMSSSGDRSPLFRDMRRQHRLVKGNTNNQRRLEPFLITKTEGALTQS